MIVHLLNILVDFSQSATKLRLQGFDQLKWQRRKAWQQFQVRLKEAISKMELWHHSLKKIEGNFGTGIVAYFLFLKWLMFLNMLLFLIMFGFIVLPTILMPNPEAEECVDSSNATVACCSESYLNLATSTSTAVTDLVQGSGIMEHTLLFYGNYTYQKLGVEGDGFLYNLPLAYICTIVAIFIVSLAAVVRSAAKGFKERVVEGEGQFYQYCNLVFGGWDYCIHNEKSAVIKHKALYNEMKGFIEAERLEDERQNRTREEKTKLFLIRLFVNLFVVLVLIGGGFLVYQIIDISNEQIQNSVATGTNNTDTFYISLNTITQLFFEFLPYICIVGLNLTIPLLFGYLVALENYSPLFVVRITLMRTVFLRLASLGVLLKTFYDVINAHFEADQCFSSTTTQQQCWETYIGQQFFKLFLTDFLLQFFVTFFVNFPRSLIARHTDNKILRFLGEQEFDLPKHVLDVVYSQTLCWLGCFFAPLLPLMAIIASFLLFYVKKFACLVNSTPSSQIYRASRSNSLFMFTLLLSYTLAIIPVGYAIAEFSPSKSCGPFREQSTVWGLVISTFQNYPDFLQRVIFFFGTAAFGIPAFIVLALLLYYYYAVSAANKHMITVLKNQLVLEGHDKQFLLNRLSAFIKQQQDQAKFRQDQPTELGSFM